MNQVQALLFSILGQVLTLVAVVSAAFLWRAASLQDIAQYLRHVGISMRSKTPPVASESRLLLGLVTCSNFTLAFVAFGCFAVDACRVSALYLSAMRSPLDDGALQRLVALSMRGLNAGMWHGVVTVICCFADWVLGGFGTIAMDASHRPFGTSDHPFGLTHHGRMIQEPATLWARRRTTSAARSNSGRYLDVPRPRGLHAWAELYDVMYATMCQYDESVAEAMPGPAEVGAIRGAREQRTGGDRRGPE